MSIYRIIPLPTIVLLAAIALLASAPGALARESDAAVVRLQGKAVAVDPATNESRELKTASPLFSGDRLQTGPDARMEVYFRDGTTLTMSADTVLTIDTYVYAGKEGGGALLDLAQGAFRAVTGSITDGANPWFQVNTPLATIGIRGTDFWGGWLEAEDFGVLMVSGDKRVVVSNPAGSVELGPGQGTTVPMPGAAPTPVKTWPQAKVDRAVATVTFD